MGLTFTVSPSEGWSTIARIEVEVILTSSPVLTRIAVTFINFCFTKISSDTTHTLTRVLIQPIMASSHVVAQNP